MYLKSTFRLYLSTGLLIYFWAIFGPVYIDFIMLEILSVIIMSIDLAIFGGLIIHKLSFDLFYLS